MILSVIGSHGGSDALSIIQRKQNDIKQFGFTFWLCISYKLKLEDTVDKPCWFLYPAGSKGKHNTSGSRPTKHSQVATQYFIDDCWKSIKDISEISGYLRADTKIIRLTSLELITDCRLDLGNYSEISGKPVKFNQHAGTISCIETPHKYPYKERFIMAHGRYSGVHLVREWYL